MATHNKEKMEYSTKISYQNLFERVTSIANHSEELSKLNGENFNIFSILGLESKENKTHSQFLATLLNPKGSHGMNDVFLSLFLKHINFDKIDFKTHSAKVVVENILGVVDNVDKTGGRLDIDIINENDFSIVIENKIYAGDQNAQIERYKNYKGEKCEVFYLTLFGNEPSKKSKGNLKSDIDFHCISYKDTITDWLEDCIKETHQQPILRETIRQYIILIKKLTGQLTNHKMENEILQLIKSNFEASYLIKNNYDKARFEISSSIRNILIEKLKEKYSNIFSIDFNDIHVTNSHIWLRLLQYQSANSVLGIETFSGSGALGSNLFIGLLDFNKKNNKYFAEFTDLQNKGWWYGRKTFPDFENLSVDFSNAKFLNVISSKNDNLNSVIEHLWKFIENYIDTYKHILEEVCLKEYENKQKI